MSSTQASSILIYEGEKESQSLYESVLKCNFDVHSSKLNSEQDVIMSNSCSPIDVLRCLPSSYFNYMHLTLTAQVTFH